MLRDTLMSNPMQIFEGLAVWVPMAIWILYLIGWMITADLDVIPGILGVAAALIVGFVAMKPPNPAMTPVLLVASVTTLVLFPFVRAAFLNREMHAIEIDALERAYVQLEEKPVNAALKFKIAKMAYQKGVPGHAIAVAESALAQLPERLFLDEHKMVRQWKRAPHPPEVFRAIPCVECGTPNPPGELHCKRCGARFLLDQAKGRWVGSTLARRLIVSWIALMVAAVGIPASTALPPAQAVTVIVLVVACVGVMLWLAFRPGPERVGA